MVEKNTNKVEQPRKAVNSSQEAPIQTAAYKEIQENLNYVTLNAEKEAGYIRNISNLSPEDKSFFESANLNQILEAATSATTESYKMGKDQDWLKDTVRTGLFEVTTENPQFVGLFLDSANSNMSYENKKLGARISVNDDIDAIVFTDFGKDKNVKFTGGVQVFNFEVPEGDGHFILSHLGHMKVDKGGVQSFVADLGFQYFGPKTFSTHFSLGGVFESPALVNEKLTVKFGLKNQIKSGQIICIGGYYEQGKNAKGKSEQEFMVQAMLKF